MQRSPAPRSVAVAGARPYTLPTGSVARGLPLESPVLTPLIAGRRGCGSSGADAGGFRRGQFLASGDAGVNGLESSGRLEAGPSQQGYRGLWVGRGRRQELGYRLPGLTLGARVQDQKTARTGAEATPKDWSLTLCSCWGKDHSRLAPGPLPDGEGFQVSSPLAWPTGACGQLR